MTHIELHKALTDAFPGLTVRMYFHESGRQHVVEATHGALVVFKAHFDVKDMVWKTGNTRVWDAQNACDQVRGLLSELAMACAPGHCPQSYSVSQLNRVLCIRVFPGVKDGDIEEIMEATANWLNAHKEPT